MQVWNDMYAYFLEILKQLLIDLQINSMYVYVLFLRYRLLSTSRNIIEIFFSTLNYQNNQDKDQV